LRFRFGHKEALLDAGERWDMVRKLERQVMMLESRLENLEQTVADHGSQLDEELEGTTK
jgi:hypothetical protein